MLDEALSIAFENEKEKFASAVKSESEGNIPNRFNESTADPLPESHDLSFDNLSMISHMSLQSHPNLLPQLIDSYQVSLQTLGNLLQTSSSLSLSKVANSNRGDNTKQVQVLDDKGGVEEGK